MGPTNCVELIKFHSNIKLVKLFLLTWFLSSVVADIRWNSWWNILTYRCKSTFGLYGNNFFLCKFSRDRSGTSTIFKQVFSCSNQWSLKHLYMHEKFNYSIHTTCSDFILLVLVHSYLIIILFSHWVSLTSVYL